MDPTGKRRGRPRTEGLGGSEKTRRRRLLEEALQLSSVPNVVLSEAGPGCSEPALSVQGSDSEESSYLACGDEDECVREPDSEPEASAFGGVSEPDSENQPASEPEASDLGGACDDGVSQPASEHEVSDFGGVCDDSVSQPGSELESISNSGFIPSSPGETLDERAESSPSTTCGNDSIFFDAVPTGNLMFDCDTCLSCRCISCSMCVHSDDGLCYHCENCLSDNFSDCSDTDESFFSCFEGDDSDSPEDYKEVISENDVRNRNIKRDLVDIALKHHLTHSALTDILLFCRKHQFGDMPRCASTLLKTARTTVTREVLPGEYWHNGLTKCVVNYVNKSNCSDVDISFSVDGVPIANSANTSFWPITCSFNDSQEVYLIGCYCGPSKPNDPNEYLRDFVDELKVLCTEGLLHHGKRVNVTCDSGIFDAPAKSFVFNTKGCNASCGCPKCTVEGETMERRMTFLQTDAPLRTDDGFRRRDQEEYHKGDTILEEIPNFKPVSQVPLDYLHLILLGIMRKLLYMWIQGPLAVRISAKDVNCLSEQLIQLNAWVPKDFVRGTRSLQLVKRFKGTEFRKLLLYVFPVVLGKSLPRKLFEHFLVLHVAVTIMVDPILCSQYLDGARELCVFFVETFKELYGLHFVSHNVHALIHIADDVERFGPLDNFSSFRFENFYQSLLKLIHKGRKPLQQLASRFSEFERLTYSKKEVNGIQLCRPHCDGPLISECVGPQFKCCILPNGTEINLSESNNCVLMDSGEMAIVKNFAHSTAGEKVFIGREFQCVSDLYTEPCQSSLLGIYSVQKLSSLKVWPTASISRKCFRMPLGDESFAVFPLRHSGKQ